MFVGHQKNLPFVLFQLKGNLCATPAQNVREILVMPQATRIPNLPPGIRGVINLRGKIIQVIDLRTKLALPTLRAETDALIQLLREREQDHRNWLNELESCVKEHRHFALARDPHQCKFGLWYDQYKTEDRLLRMTIPSMDAPHQTIHATADEVLRLAEGGDSDRALNLISVRRDRELAALIKLFEESRRILVDGLREVALVLSRGKDLLAFSVDFVESAEEIQEECIEPMPVMLAGWSKGFYCRIGKRSRTNQTVLILDEEFFFGFTATSQNVAEEVPTKQAGLEQEVCGQIE